MRTPQRAGPLTNVRLGALSFVRQAIATDSAFLQSMLAIAVDWRPGSSQRQVREILADPALARYIAGWPRPDDFGVIAESDVGESLGAAWCRTFSADDSGFGFVAADVPEVSIGVLADARGEGIGRSLMVHLIGEARSRGIAQLSLSVELANHARYLYASLGFTIVKQEHGAVTMVLEVD